MLFSKPTVDVTYVQSWENPKIENTVIIPRYHNEILGLHTNRRKNGFLESNLASCSTHFNQTCRSFEKENLADNVDPQTLFLPSTQDGVGDCFSVQTKAIVINDKNEVHKAAKKTRKKSSKKRRSKTSVKRHKNFAKHLEKHNSNKGKNDQNEENHSEALTIKSTQLSACPQLPTKLLNGANQKAKSFYLQNQSVKLPNAVTKQHKLLSRSVTKKNLSNENLPHVANDKLQLHHVNRKSDNKFSTTSADTKSLYAPNNIDKKSSKKLPAREGSYDKELQTSRSIDQTLKNNSLKDRLNLIHCYGNDYLTITQQYETQKKKQKILRQHQDRMVEKIESDKKKHLQRKKIYALNRLMTELEHNKFEQFMKNLSSSR